MYKRFTAVVLGLMLAVASFFAQSSPAFAAPSAIDSRYNFDSELRDLLGSPTSSESSIDDGRLKHYQNGTLYWSPATGVHEVHGSIRDRFRSYGGVQKLGFPKTDEFGVWVNFVSNEIGRANTFENGTISWAVNTGAKVLSTLLASRWLSAVDELLMPITDEQAVPNGRRVKFPSGAAVYSTSAGANILFDTLHGYDIKIDEKWGAKGGAWSFLGPPVDELEYLDFNADGINEGTFQDFDNGIIYWKGDYELGSAAPEAYEVHGAILDRYLDEGGPQSLGLPITDQKPFETGQRSRFEHADIIWHPSGATIVIPT